MFTHSYNCPYHGFRCGNHTRCQVKWKAEIKAAKEEMALIDKLRQEVQAAELVKRTYGAGFSPSEAQLPAFEFLVTKGVLYKNGNAAGPGGIFRFTDEAKRILQNAPDMAGALKGLLRSKEAYCPFKDQTAGPWGRATKGENRE